MQQLKLDTPYITLGQLLKRLDLISSGGHAKFFLEDVAVKINGQIEHRRGKKIYPQDVVDIEGYEPLQVV
ncbi:S4 domain-containing protein YaaA [Hazenella sp. IB182357]|uniref:S4 domain-containing protein YaaA n=1 Tax=Polycladospora coralii TaxID=2771432 RepID=A0A926RSV4_9BACL|nr:S4 domain-containing protein YaaA [Polycladospora coralii]MBD1371970.1 S4 domain-containing protein YaaA [Polycladospora coralii]MBS7530474.1 S4 domain-containing protein YaaA [Polycladospora coralii]